MFFLLVCQSFEPLHSLSKRGLEVFGGTAIRDRVVAGAEHDKKRGWRKLQPLFGNAIVRLRSDGAPTAENGHRCQPDGQQGPGRRLRNGGDGDVIKGNSIPRLKVDPNILTESPTKDQKVIVGNSRIDG